MSAKENIEEILVKENELEKGIDLLSQLEFLVKFVKDVLRENDFFKCFERLALDDTLGLLDFPLGDEGFDISGELRMADFE